MLLGRTMKSVAEQVYPYYEHIIMDGCSSDRTMSVAQEYAEKDERIIIHSEKDNGLYDAMNKALNLVTGDYVVFLNAGDKLFNTPTSWTTLEYSCTHAACSRHGTSHGEVLSGVCWFAIRLFTQEQTWQRRHRIILHINTPPT